MLPPYRCILLPPLIAQPASRDLDALAIGFAEDLALLMNRLGDVKVLLVEGDAGPMEDELVLRGSFTVLTDGISVAISLRDARGGELWADRAELADGLVRDARLVLAANLIESATGRRKDVRRARLGGTQHVEAYKRVCLARYPGLPPLKRMQVLEEALRLDTEYAEAQLLLADALEAHGQRDRAREILAGVARSHPRFSWARQRYGVALRVAGFDEDAVAEVQAALDTDPDGLTLFHAGLFAEAGGDPRTAMTLYQRAVERGCIEAVLCDKLARLQANAGKPKAAIPLWERARRLDPNLEHLLGNLALAHHHAGGAVAAEALFDEAIGRAPDAFSTHAHRAVWLQDLGKHVEAIEACTRALSIRSDSPLTLNNRGVSKLAIGDRSGARRDFEQALEFSPGPELAIYIRANLARIARGNARVDEASRMLRRGVELVQHERPREAIPLLLEALDLYPESAPAWLMLALAYREERLWEQCADALAQVLRVDGRSAWALSERALALLALGRNDEAFDHARLATQVDPDEAGFVCNLGLVELERGRFEEAGAAFDLAHEIDPGDPVVDLCLKELKRRRRKDPRWGQVGFAS